MINDVRQITIRNLISPYGFASISFALFLTAWIAPPSLFLTYIGEPDLLYLNPLVLIFYGSCVLFFLAGARVFDFFKGPASSQAPVLTCTAPLRFLLIPLGVSTLLCAGSVAALNGSVSNLAGLFLSQQGALIKLANASGQAEEGSWGYVITFHTGMLWWAYSRSKQLIPGGPSRTIFKVCFAGAVAVSVLTALIKVDRTNLIPIISGLFVIYLYAKLAGREVRLSSLLPVSLVLCAVLLGLFLGVSYIRGSSDAGLLVAGIFGYTATSYNRLAAEVSGLLNYSFGGRGVYLSTFVSFNNTINRIIPFNALMGAPTERGVYYSEFSSIAAAGLNPGFNWSGAFGYIFADLGWWTPLYLGIVGVFNGYVWREFRKQSIVGIILYPWAAFSILFWFGWNILFDLRFALLAVVIAAMGIYESCLLRRHAVPDKVDPSDPSSSPDGPVPDPVGSIAVFT